MAVEERIWDPIIRGFHWTVAVAFLLNYFALEEGGEPHEIVGYYILCALLVRFIWGVVGSKNGRFSHFFPTLAGVKAHLNALRAKQIPEENGHNPVGALMIFALLFGLLATGLSGWGMETIFWGEDWIEELHEFFASFTLGLTLVHVFAVVLFTIAGPRNLIRQMLTGRVSKN
ncbi:cytochrome b/b6 domain-containing protein [Marinomonas ostreistagni]|uniref:cytochrome b/b6 domain-containing protein n=1 Tax=Marinomonas ostreistagni TaxID=359209 RepID=UPI0019528708|nr:cytochrome b/b6 domain-containing protein [Marinomonas ostreistagni]MBM6551816.1 cytochrome b/b6 domain-containing protein [Marinomonas ostreistagni]